MSDSDRDTSAIAATLTMFILRNLGRWDAALNPKLAVVLPGRRYFQMSGLEALIRSVPKPIACVAPAGMPSPCLIYWTLQPGELEDDVGLRFASLLIEQLGSQADPARSKVRFVVAHSHMDVTIQEYGKWASSYILPLNSMTGRNPDSRLASEGIVQIIEVQPWTGMGSGDGMRLTIP